MLSCLLIDYHLSWIVRSLDGDGLPPQGWIDSCSWAVNNAKEVKQLLFRCDVMMKTVVENAESEVR